MTHRIALSHASSVAAEAILEKLPESGIESDSLVLLDHQSNLGKRVAFGGTHLALLDQQQYNYSNCALLMMPEADPELEAEPTSAPAARLSAADLGPLDSIDLAVAAVRAEGQHDLARAVELWTLAAEATTLPKERGRYQLRAYAAGCQHDLRAALVAGFAAEADLFSAVGVERLELDGLDLNGTELGWQDLTPRTLLELASSVKVTEGETKLWDGDVDTGQVSRLLHGKHSDAGNLAKRTADLVAEACRSGWTLKE